MIANDSDIGLAGIDSETPPFKLKPKTLANGMHETRQDAACARPGPAQAGRGESRPGSPVICVGLQVVPGQQTSQFGVRHRCFPGLR